jgi:hypothetical protein
MNNTGAVYEPNVEILNVTTHTNGSIISNSQQQQHNVQGGTGKKSKTMIFNSPYGVS